MRLRATLVTLALASSSLAGTAQFGEITLVTIPVTITDAGGTPVTPELTAANFRVKEDGKEQAIALVSPGPGPISVSVVLDASASMIGTQHRLAERAVLHLVANLSPQDEISVVRYTQPTKWAVAVPWASGANFPALDWATWPTLPFSDQLNGVRHALFTMDGARHPRRAVLSVTAMEEVASAFALSQYHATQAHSETAIYALWTEDVNQPRNRQPEGGFTSGTGRMVTFDDLLRDGGGRWFAVRNPAEAHSGVDRFLDELRKQYVIRYQPSKPFDGTPRRLKVELKDTKDLKIRHRTGYLAKRTT